MNRELIELNDSLLIGVGGHKKVYRHPLHDALCIKILLDGEDDPDWQKEMRYRRSREKRGLSSRLMTAYHGKIETSLGDGYVFERVIDFDGTSSKTMDEWIEAMRGELETDAGGLVSMLINLRDMMLSEEIITYNMETENFMLQRVSKNEILPRVIDNLGSASHLPLAFFFSAIARKHIKKYWTRFSNDLSRIYPTIIDDEAVKKLTDWK